MIPLISVIKTLELRLLDHDRAVQMRSASFHQSRYNSFNLSTCFDHLRWIARARDQRAIFRASPDPTPCVSPHQLQSLNCVRLSPTREKLSEIDAFIRPDGLEGLKTLPIYGRLNTHYINI